VDDPAFRAEQHVGIGRDGAVADVGQAIGRSVKAGHWPERGPTDERLTEIANNFSRTRHLIERDGRPSEPATPEMQTSSPPARGQVMHTLYVAAHGTAVALDAYVTDLQHRLEVGGRRRQPMIERPTALEITAAQGMIARFSGFEQLAAAYVAATSANPDQAKAAAPGARLAAALAGWEVQAHRTLAASRTRLIWFGWLVCRRSSPAPPASSPKPPRKRAISTATFSND
jgi:hypothetical protein